MDNTEKRARLVDEFRTILDEPLIISILSDYDLGSPGHVEAARGILESVAKSAAVEEASGFDASGLGQEKGTLTDDTPAERSNSTTGTSPSSTGGLKPAPNPDGLQLFKAVHVFDSLSEDEKVKQLQRIFSELKLHDIKFSLKKSNGNVTAAIEELLTIQHLETTGQREKGVDAFFTEDDPPPRKKGRKGKAKGRGKVKKYPEPAFDSDPSQSSAQSRGWSASGSSETDASSDVSAPTLAELGPKGQEEVTFVATRLNIAESEVSKVYVASNCSLPHTIESFIDAFLRMGLDATHMSLNSRVAQMKNTYIDIPHKFLPCIADMTETQAHANDIAGVLQGYYAKPGKTRLYIDYNLKPVDMDAEEPMPKRSSASSMVHVNRPVQPVLPLKPVSASSPSSTPSAAPRNANVWSTVQRKKSVTQSPRIASSALPSQTVAESRDAAFRAASRAYRIGTTNPLWRQAAAVYHQRGVENRRQATAMEADRAVAANHTEDSVDLHGVFVADGVRIARQAVQAWWAGLDSHRGIEAKGKVRLARDLGGFRVITGRGIHSEGGKSKLRPAVLSALVQDGWNVQSNTGAFIVTGKR